MALTKVIGNGIGTLGDGTANDTKIVFDGNAQDFHIGLDDSTDSLTVGLGSALGTTSHIVVNSDGVVTTPKIPMVLAQGATTAIDSGTTDFWYIAIPERYDTTNAYAPSTGIFTAPVDGKYFVYSHMKFSSEVANAHITASVNSAAQGGGGGYDANNAWQIQTGNYVQWTGMVNVSANDTIRMVLYPDGAKNTLDTSNRNHFVVYLVG
jgi:hypothetical protein